MNALPHSLQSRSHEWNLEELHGSWGFQEVFENDRSVFEVPQALELRESACFLSAFRCDPQSYPFLPLGLPSAAPEVRPSPAPLHLANMVRDLLQGHAPSWATEQ